MEPILYLIPFSFMSFFYALFLDYRIKFLKNIVEEKEDLEIDIKEVQSTLKPRLRITSDSRLKSFYYVLKGLVGISTIFEGSTFKVEGFGDVVSLIKESVLEPFLVLCVKDNQCWFSTTMSSSELEDFLSKVSQETKKPNIPKKTETILTPKIYPYHLDRTAYAGLRDALFRLCIENRRKDLSWNSNIFYVDDSLFYSVYGKFSVRLKENSRVLFQLNKETPSSSISLTSNANLTDLMTFVRDVVCVSSKTPLKDNSENIWKSLFLKRDCTYRVKGSLFTVIYRERYSSLKKEVYESMIVLRNGTDIYEVKKIVPKIHREFHVRYMVTKNSYDVNNILNVILGIEDLFSK